MRFRVFSVVLSLALVIGVSLAVGSAGSARPISPFAKGTAAAAPASAPDALVTLYDNSTNDSGIGITSQSALDTMGADDFDVPAGHVWVVKEVTAYGVYYNGSGADSEHVSFYTQKKKLPNAVKKDYPALAGADNGGSFQITLPTTVRLSGGPAAGSRKHYYVSVQANMDFGFGQWDWETSTNTSGYPDAAWQNPGGGSGTGCTSWEKLHVCLPYGEGPSFMFTLKGKDIVP